VIGVLTGWDSSGRGCRDRRQRAGCSSLRGGRFRHPCRFVPVVGCSTCRCGLVATAQIVPNTPGDGCCRRGVVQSVRPCDERVTPVLW